MIQSPNRRAVSTSEEIPAPIDCRGMNRRSDAVSAGRNRWHPRQKTLAGVRHHRLFRNMSIDVPVGLAASTAAFVVGLGKGNFVHLQLVLAFIHTGCKELKSLNLRVGQPGTRLRKRCLCGLDLCLILVWGIGWGTSTLSG